MRSLLIGPGAIGGSAAALIIEAGFQLDIVCKSEETKEKLKNKGFRLTGVKGEHNVEMNAFSAVDQLEGFYDVVIISTKIGAMPGLAEQILPYIKEDSVVLAMQNGICIPLLAEAVGENRAAGCMIGYGATLKGPGEAEMTSLGRMAVGFAKGGKTPQIEHLCTMLNAVLPTVISDDIYADLFSKLIMNSCITALGAVTGETLGNMLGDIRARNLFLKTAREGIAVAKAMGIDVPPFSPVLNYKLLTLSEAEFYNSIVKTAFRVIGLLKYKNVKASFLQSLERGEKTEVGIVNGFIAKKGAELSVPTPANAKLTAMIHEIEDKKREISMDNLSGLIF
ncbi:MAG: ketopantoate reductase family protein [Oscillospiraceae bacterium]|nr:ketopantoate reductase family protein [Oscillospiraceae bacterium]